MHAGIVYVNDGVSTRRLERVEIVMVCSIVRVLHFWGHRRDEECVRGRLTS